MQYAAMDTESTDLTGQTLLGWSWGHKDGTFGSAPYDFDTVQQFLDTYRPVFWNAKFDVRVLRQHGHTFTNGYEDAMLVWWVLDPTHETYGLNAVGEREGLGSKLTQPESWEKWTDEMATYAAQDAKLTWDLWARGITELQRDIKARRLYRYVELPYLEVIIEMESTGFVIDNPKLNRLIAHLTKKSEALTAAVQRLVGLIPVVTYEPGVGVVPKPDITYKRQVPMNGTMFKTTTRYKVPKDYVLQAGEELVSENKKTNTITKLEWQFYQGMETDFVGMASATVFDHCKVQPFNPSSNAQVAYVLESRYGWTPTKFTKTGQPQTGSDVLAELNYPIAKLLTTLAEVNKVLGSFLLPFKEKQDSNGVLHGEFNQTGTKTGRLSSRNPNLQNIPVGGSYGSQVRSLVTVPSSEWALVGIDLSNIEGRVLAHYLAWRMKDYSLANIFKQGLDFHSENTINWGLVHLFYKGEADRLIEEYRETGNAKLIKRARQAAKTALYAVLYGAGAEKVGVSSGGDKELGETIMRVMEENAPAIFALKEMVWDFATKHEGVIHTYFGRRLVYPNLVPEIALENARRLIKDGVVDDTPQRLARSLTSRSQRQVFNALLQGTAADTLKILEVGVHAPLLKDIAKREEVLWDLWVLMEMGAVQVAHGYGAWKAASIHDELQFYTPVKHVEAFKKDLTLLFQAPLFSHVNISGDAVSGTNWADTH